MKGRCVFARERCARREPPNFVFQLLISSPATLEAAESVDAFGLLPGHNVEQCVAQQAYVQSKLGVTPTWVALPKILRPKELSKFRDPVVRLKLALY
eukprot:6722020-Heterocapsa_arctica.AAC.1